MDVSTHFDQPLTSWYILLGYARPFVIGDNRWDEKSGLQRDALSSQVIDALEAQEIKEAGYEEPYRNATGRHSVRTKMLPRYTALYRALRRKQPPPKPLKPGRRVSREKGRAMVRIDQRGLERLRLLAAATGRFADALKRAGPTSANSRLFSRAARASEGR